MKKNILVMFTSQQPGIYWIDLDVRIAAINILINEPQEG